MTRAQIDGSGEPVLLPRNPTGVYSKKMSRKHVYELCE